MDSIESGLERQRLLALKIYCLDRRDRNSIFKSLSSEVKDEFNLLFRQIESLGVSREMARDFVWGDSEPAHIASPEMGWPGFISMLQGEGPDHSGGPGKLIQYIQSRIQDRSIL